MTDETPWEKCDGAPLFARIEGGRNPSGQMWRRKVDGRWQYRQDEETAEEFADRQY